MYVLFYLVFLFHTRQWNHIFDIKCLSSVCNIRYSISGFNPLEAANALQLGLDTIPWLRSTEDKLGGFFEGKREEKEKEEKNDDEVQIIIESQESLGIDHSNKNETSAYCIENTCNRMLRERFKFFCQAWDWADQAEVRIYVVNA